MKLYRTLQKRFFLPLKWAYGRSKKIKSIVYPERTQIYDQYHTMRLELPIQQRLNNDLEAAKIQGRMEVLEWILDYGDTKA